ncbi:MAG: tetratricopeptide repeat protein [Planctomycetes bacterium]|nr:tetratricopeptide repeat protein [Planctomycetota bacterium]
MNEENGASPNLGPATELLDGEISAGTLARFRNRMFSQVRELEKVRDWLRSPMANGLRRGIALWALGRHNDALPILEEHRANSAIANCIARSLLELGRVDDALSLLGKHTSDPDQAATYLACKARRGSADELHKALEEVRGVLLPADIKCTEGRVHELRDEPESAIACYDAALAIDQNHAESLFRLAVNVDLRGEDEEARELYERALMLPPVNEACVINLGILYEDMGNYRRAMQCFDLALQANPENKRARMYRRDAAAALNMYYDEEQERREDKRNKILRTPINDFELSVRSRNCLSNMGIRTLGDLVNKTEAELLSFKNFGETSLMEIKEILRNKGLRLGMNQDELMSKDLGQMHDAQMSPEEMPDPNSPDPAKRPVTELDLSVRCRRIVDLLKIKTIGDLATKSEAELLACPNFGQTSLNEIRTKLDELGLSLRS